MANNREIVLKKIAAVPEDRVVRTVRDWLARQDTRPISDSAVQVTAHDALHVWRVRLKISLDKGRTLQGGSSLVERLSKLTPQKKLEQFSFSGTDISGSLFFEKTSGSYVGAVLADRISEPEQLSRAS